MTGTAKSELNEIKRAGGKPQPNSGRGTHKKGDGMLYPFCFDVKEYAKSYSISRKSWAKCCTDAWSSNNSLPALNLVLGDTERVRLWVISDATFQEMREAWIEKYGESE